jgi:anaerobic selenocysteine-containing dehydrogenase
MPTLPSACPLDCPDACSLEVEVHAGRLVSVQGDRRNPFTRGFICGKVRNIRAHLEGPERILTPLVRRGRKGDGEFEPISYDAALDLAAGRLAEIRARLGGEAILPFCYGGSNGYLSHGSVDARFFRRLGASRLLRTFCAAPSGRAATGLYGRMPGVALPDYVHSRLIVIWGCNPSASGIHLVPIVKEARARGALLVVVDPRRTPLARDADLHLAVRPGTDLVVALAVIHALHERGATDQSFLDRHCHRADELFRRAAAWSLDAAAEEAGVAKADLETFVDLYAAANPAVIRCGWGVERSRSGGSATAAILALPAVAGKFGVRGGGYTMSNSGAWKLSTEDAAGAPEPATRTVNMSRLGEALLALRDPPIAALFVYDANPLSTAPAQEKVRRGLEREDLFTIVHEQVLTDTVRYADLVFPATSFLEHHEISRGYGAYVLHDSPPVIEPPGLAKSNIELFLDLLDRMGLSQPSDLRSVAELRHAILHSSGDGDRLERELGAAGLALPPCGSHPVPFVDSFPLLPDRKADLCPPALDREVEGGLYAYKAVPGDCGSHPFALISPASARTISSTFGQTVAGEAALEISPADAAVRGLATGSLVRVWNEFGEVHVRTRVNPELRPGVLVLPKGLWARHTRNGRTANALAPDHLSDLGGGACYNDARVSIARLAPT